MHTEPFKTSLVSYPYNSVLIITSSFQVYQKVNIHYVTIVCFLSIESDG